MAHLSLVKSVSQLKEERQFIDELVLDPLGLVLTRGTVAEISGEPSSGKISVVLSMLAKLTVAGEICAAVDAADGFDPCTATLAGVELDNLLWVRCGGNFEKAFMSADYLVQAKGFGAIWLNLCGLSERQLRMVPKTYWYRYRTRIKETPTLFIVTSTDFETGSASNHALNFTREQAEWSGTGSFKLLRSLRIKMHSRRELWGQPLRAKVEVDYSDV